MIVIQTAMLVGVAFMLAVGQILLKIGVTNARSAPGGDVTTGMFSHLLLAWQFWAAILVSGAVMVFWAWILTFIPLAKAYPFVVLAFVFAGILEAIIFGQSLSASFFVGCALILGGLLIIVR